MFIQEFFFSIIPSEYISFLAKEAKTGKREKLKCKRLHFFSWGDICSGGLAIIQLNEVSQNTFQTAMRH